jgi:hypothetical protein
MPGVKMAFAESFLAIAQPNLTIYKAALALSPAL